MITNITQVRRVVFAKTSDGGSTWDTFTLEPDDLGQDTIGSVNIAPRKRTRNSAVGTTESPIKGTFAGFAGSIQFLLDNWKKLGQALDAWNEATYAGAAADAGNMTDGAGDSAFCNDGEYFDIILQGICDDGSTADIELTRCQPSVDDDIEIGTSETPTVTLALNPIIYNANLHADDGYPQYSYRFGDKDLTKKQRLNATTGKYYDVTASA